MAAHSDLQQGLQTAERERGEPSLRQPSVPSLSRTHDEESTLPASQCDSCIQEDEYGMDDRTSETVLDEDIGDPGGYGGMKTAEPGRGRKKEMARIETSDMQFRNIVDSSEIPGMPDTSSQAGTTAVPPSTVELAKSAGSALEQGLDIAPSDQTAMVNIDKGSEEEVKMRPDPTHTVFENRRGYCISHRNSMSKEAAKSGEPIEDLSEVAVQKSFSAIDLVPDCHGSAGVVEEAGHLSDADETGASAHSCQTISGHSLMVVADGSTTCIKAVNTDNAENLTGDGRDSPYRPDGANGRHTEAGTFHPLERLRRSRMLEHPKAIFRLARGLADAVGSGATDLDADIEMGNRGTTDGGDGNSQSPPDTDSSSDGDDRSSGDNVDDDSQSTSSGDSSGDSHIHPSHRTRPRHHRHHCRRGHRGHSTGMTKYQKIRLGFIGAGIIIAIVNLVFMYAVNDGSGSIGVKIAKRMSHAATLFIL